MPQHEDSRLPDVQVWDVTNLEINMHCDCRGCKGKLDGVIKTIQSCEGVDYITTDADEQKVIVSANVASAKVLLKKLLKSRKHTQLCQVDQNCYVADDRQLKKNTFFSDWKIGFKMETLVAATGNFHDHNKLGEGSFGTVYKGTHDGKQIAVKKLSSSSKQGSKEFLNEVEILSKIQHRNFVKLLGCCEERSEKLLVYEYLPNQSLDKFLDDADKRKDLDWQKRYNIILGVACGLSYIHEDTTEHIVHRDIKPSNILLDKDLNPKIGDLGIARLFPEDKTHVSTEFPRGTFGYMAPECVMEGQVTVKADVYSFGVVLLQLMTGRNAIGGGLQEPLVKWVWRSYEEGEIGRTIDSAIIETGDKKQALRCIHIGLLCTQADSSRRPPMREVYSMLSEPCKPVPLPKTPTSVTADASITNSVYRRTMAHRNGHVTAMKWKLETL